MPRILLAAIAQILCYLSLTYPTHDLGHGPVAVCLEGKACISCVTFDS